MVLAFPTAVIENLSPLVDGGRYPVKRIVGDDLVVEADIFKDGHDVVAAVLKWRLVGEEHWHETPMTHIDNDRWRGACTLYDNATYEYTVEAWADTFRGWQREFRTKLEAGVSTLTAEALEGVALLEAAAQRAHVPADAIRLHELSECIRTADNEQINEIAYSGELEVLMSTYPDRSASTQYAPPARVVVDRAAARVGAWYEFFPRSAEGRADHASTFRDCLPRIDYARAMGFNVIYFPPIHPIGRTNRKGRNNALFPEPGDPGVPWAIGNEAGGHKAVEPSLGTLEDFDWLQGEVRKRGMEIALDFAINCSPDHPYVREHPEWFYTRPDGSIKYAENPPKKYEDIYPLNFRCENWLELWKEMLSIVLFWAEHGVRIFRVDNPHTKPIAFWEYLIGNVRERYPDVIFLSEAFTKPKMMKALAKAGFSQSYTYFTWRNSKQELTDYFTKLTQMDMREYFRGNLWPNTPDILPFVLQDGGRPAFIIRVVLAATLSSVYGIYSGYELCENEALPGREEYLNSEKYQLKERDWNAPGNIKDWITRLNQIRAENRALQVSGNLRFYHADNPAILFYVKMTEARDNIILVVVNLDPHRKQHSFVDVPIDRFGAMEGDTYQVQDLFTDARYTWRGRRNYVELDPEIQPAHIFRVRRWLGGDRFA
ncbi:MAG TPA: alpha-1,4-glucan--maltose-1-phosphate maltosyltransferase [Chthoniobacterales bacterium]|jgi:starch synthase (maltosyl-transferring)|nr:alpha-1,4-glucan--maltose-1-phosphate maltosyltransferase [Chthoniobacterales bacterium]